jgi:hypothetical protein
MTLRKKINSRFKLLLRRMGMLCRKPKAKTKRIRIKRTINPDGTVTDHDHLTEQPLYIGSTFETELHIWKEIHKDTKKTKSKK